MRNLGQKGFTALEGLLIVTAVLLLGVGGYYVYSQNTKEDQAVVENTDNSSDDQQETDTDIYEIPELGLYLSKEVIGYDDLAHEVVSEQTEDQSVTIGIYSKDLRERLEASGQNGCNETIAIFYYDTVEGGARGVSPLQYDGKNVYVGYLGSCEAADQLLQGEMTSFGENVYRAVGFAIDNPVDAIVATQAYCSEMGHICQVTVIDESGEYVVTSGGDYRYLVAKETSGASSVVIASEEDNICDTGTDQPDLVKYCSL